MDIVRRKIDRILKDYLKGKRKLMNRGVFINEDREPPDKINTNNSQQLNTKKGKRKNCK